MLSSITGNDSQNEFDHDFDVAALLHERLRPLFDRHAARDQAVEPALIGRA